MKRKMTTLYKYVSLKRLEDIIENGRLYLGNWKDFNDPFELTIFDRKRNDISHIEGLHILCLTNSNCNKLMWAHYADSHKGVCIVVKVPTDLVYPVCYTSKRVTDDCDVAEILKKNSVKPKKNLQKSYNDLSYEKKVSYVKDRKWGYEKEYRIVYDDNEVNSQEIIQIDDKFFYENKSKTYLFWSEGIKKVFK